MFDNVAQNNGLVIALIGITVVFVGLVLIAVIISLFNRVFLRGRQVSDTDRG